MKLLYESSTDAFVFKANIFDKDIPIQAGFEFDVEFSFWYTFNHSYALKLEKYAKDEKTKAKLREIKNKEDDILEKSWSEKSNFMVPKPDNGYEYYPHQLAGIEYIYERPFTLLGDQMGLGKTSQTIGTFNKMQSESKEKLNWLIICPATMKDVWAEELKVWLSNYDDYTISINTGSGFELADIMIVNFEAFNATQNKKSSKYRDPKKGEFNPTFFLFKELNKVKKINLLAVDESHKLKEWSSNTTKNIFKLKKKVEKTIFMTGTAIFAKPEEIWTTIRFANMTHHFMGDKLSFLEYYSDARFDFRRRRMVSGEPKNLDELQRNLRKHFMIRRTSSEGVYRKVRNIIPLDVEIKNIDKYETLKRKIVDVSYLETGESKRDDSKSIIGALQPTDIVEFSQFRKECGIAKIKQAVKFIDDILETGEKVILFGYHKEVLAYYKELYPDSAMIVGSTPQKDRIKEIEKFQKDPNCKVFIGNLDSASVGITLTASSTVIFVEMGVTPAIMFQAEARASRIGQTKIVNVFYLVAKNTLDAYIAETLIRKNKIVEQSLDKEKLINYD